MSEKLSKFTQAYIDCALWSSTDNSREDGGDPLDDNYSLEDIAPECLKQMMEDCAAFQYSCAALLEQAGSDEQNGHDFWLTRNGHGAGFWDRGYANGIGDQLTEMARPYGQVNLYLGDDGLIYSI